MRQEKFGPRELNRNTIKHVINIIRERPVKTMEIVDRLMTIKRYPEAHSDIEYVKYASRRKI
jgi:hypothetical protein